MDSSSVAIVAASIAAVASMVSLVVNVWYARRGAREAQFRELMKPYIVQLGEDLHQVVACCQVLVKKAALGKNTEPWFKRAHDACGRLKELQRRLKYPLGEVTEGIRELTRLANWVDHSRADETRRVALVDAADRLRRAVDGAVRSAFLEGSSPSSRHVSDVRKAADALRALWDGQPEEEAEALSPLLAPLSVEGNHMTAEVPPERLERVESTPDDERAK